MKKIKKSFSIISGLVLALAMFISGFGLVFNPKILQHSSVSAMSAPEVSGNWTDGIGGLNSADDLTRKSYNNGRSGTEEYPYLIRTPQDLAYLSVLTSSNFGALTKYYYRLDADIDLAGKNWVPIGTSNNTNNRFYGAIDGTIYDLEGNPTSGKYKISNLSIVDAVSTYRALIGFTDPAGYNIFENIDFVDSYISSVTQYNAVLVAYSNGPLTVDNVTFTGQLQTTYSGDANTATVVSYVNYTGEDISFSNIVTSVDIYTTANYAAGVVARFNFSGATTLYDATNITFDTVVNNGNIEGNTYIAGIVATTSSTNFVNVRNNGNISGNLASGNRIAGIVAEVYYKVYMSQIVNNGTITGNEVGGIICNLDTRFSPSADLLNDVVLNTSTMDNVVNNGTIIGNNRTAGILVYKSMQTNTSLGDIDGDSVNETFEGESKQTTLFINNSHNYGELVVYNTGAGLVNYVVGNISITNSSNNAEISNTGQYANIGGLIGETYRSNTVIENSFNKGNLSTGNAQTAGGLVGYTYTANNNYINTELYILNSYNLGVVEARDNIGGLVGYIYYTNLVIENSFNMGNVLGSAGQTGGLVGQYYVSMTSSVDFSISSIYRSYNIGSVTGGSAYVGGIFGYINYQNTDNAVDVIIYIEESFSNAYIQLGTATQTGGLIGRVNFANRPAATGEQIIDITESYSLFNPDFDTMTLYNYNSIAQPNYGVINYDTLVTTLPIDPEDPMSETYDVTTGSRILTANEFKDENTFSNYLFYGQPDGVWAMPDERGNGNNGAPYLYEIAGVELTLVITDTQTVTYHAVMNEEFSLEFESKGLTFMGWSTLPEGEGSVYEAGMVYTLSNQNATLYGMFEYTPYYRVIIEDESGTSLAGEFVITKDSVNVTETFDDDYADGLRIGTPENVEYFLHLLDSGTTLPQFEGWQVLKPTSQGVGTWYTISSKTIASVSYGIKDSINNSTFRQEYLYTYSTPILEDQLYSVVGEFRFRAAKTSVAVQVAATTVESGLGSITVNGQAINFSGLYTHTFPEGTTITLEANPVDYYRVGSYIITNGASTEVLNVSNPSLNRATYTIQTGDASLVILVEFVPVEYAVTTKLETRQGVEITEDLLAVSSLATVVVGQDADIELIASSSTKYVFYGYKIYNKVENDFDFFFGSNSFVKDDYVTNEFLSAYLANGTVEIVAVYREVYTVSVSAEIGGTLSVTVQDIEGQVIYTGESLDNVTFEEGSTVVVYATPNDYYNFGQYVTDNSAVISGRTLSIVVTEDVDINTTFNLQMYEVVVQAFDNKNKTQLPSTGIVAYINGSSALNLAKIGDVITATSQTAPVGYRIDNFKLRNAGNEVNLPTAGITIDDAFLTTYLTSENKIVIAGYYVRQYYVNITLPQDQTIMGSVTVNEAPFTNVLYFDIDTTVEIEVTVNKHYQLDSVSGVFDYERVTGEPTKFNLSVNSDRTLRLSFSAIEYQVSFGDLISGEGVISYNTDKVKIGDKLVIMFAAPAGQDVKSWKINDVAIANLPENVVVSDNSITITVTEEWLTEYASSTEPVINLTNAVSTGLNSGILTVIIGVSVVVPTLLIILVLAFVKNAQQRKLVYAELKEKEVNRLRYDTSSFINDLREGKNAGTVSEADVKAEMKRRKDEKKK